ncbi:hypothetical protein ADL28_39680 [Streptomyces violaceusniger]|uniref:Uncharacterized protein n=1 Tax=Streptomyces violaceusniger TaxID=68280 RepID=A0A0X3VIM9_STRVO|nr:hypothetical protein ADL28_39680 [Streptomyces violaceusniger]
MYANHQVGHRGVYLPVVQHSVTTRTYTLDPRAEHAVDHLDISVQQTLFQQGVGTVGPVECGTFFPGLVLVYRMLYRHDLALQPPSAIEGAAATPIE